MKQIVRIMTEIIALHIMGALGMRAGDTAVHAIGMMLNPVCAATDTVIMWRNLGVLMMSVIYGRKKKMSEQFRKDTKMVLKQCPFCGGEAEIRKVHSYEFFGCSRYFIQCMKCGNYNNSTRKEEDAIEEWNTRKPMERIVERLEDIKKCGGMEALVYNQGVCDSIEIVRKGGAE